MELPHTKTVEEVYEFFKVREEEGLSGERVTKLREQYGPNGTLLWFAFKCTSFTCPNIVRAC